LQAQASKLHRTIVLGRNWLENPWDQPPRDDGKIPLIVLAEYPDNIHATLGGWLKKHLRTDRNTVRFLLPSRSADGASNIYLDEELMLAARAATLARDWSRTEAAYKSLSRELIGALQKKLADRFDRFAILSVWNHADPAKCQFSIERHGAQGEHIPAAIQDKIKQDLFADEEFDELVADFTRRSLPVSRLIAELREPRGAGLRCIPWLGEAEVEDRLRAAYALHDLGADMPAAHDFGADMPVAQDVGAGIPQGRREQAAGQIKRAGADIPPIDAGWWMSGASSHQPLCAMPRFESTNSAVPN
jgi:hypothetical protein